MLSSLQDGIQLDLFGQDHHHASPSAQQVNKKEKKMNDTSGLLSSNSSESANLQQYLENKLRQQLPKDGMTIYKMTWKQKVTPRGWQYYQLVASTPRTNETDCSSWPTPAARDHRDTGNLETSRFRKDGTERKDTVPRIAWLSQTGERLSNYSSETVNGVPFQLNPRFSLWLMGYPIEWASCGEQVTLSSRK